MALAATTTKIWPTFESAGQIRIGVELVLTDDDVEVVREIFTTNTEKTGDPETQASKITDAVNARIKKYKDEKQAFEHSKMNDFETAITGGIEL